MEKNTFLNKQSKRLKKCLSGRKKIRAARRCAGLFKKHVYEQLGNKPSWIKGFGIYLTRFKPQVFISRVNKQRNLVLKTTKSKLRKHLNNISNNRAVSLSICAEKITNPKIKKRKNPNKHRK